MVTLRSPSAGVEKTCSFHHAAMPLSDDDIHEKILTTSDIEIIKLIRWHAEQEYREDEARLVEKLGNIRNFQQLQRMTASRACPNTPGTDIVLPEQHVRQSEEELALAQEAWRQKRMVFNVAIDEIENSRTLNMYQTFVELHEKLDCIKVETERRLLAIRAEK